MKAAVLTGIRELEIRDVPDPEIRAADDVLLRIETVGVCGSDIHYYVNGRIGNRIVEYPFAVGHECAATVAAVGSGCKELQPGDRVTVDPAVHCGDCDQCRAGRFHTCRNLRFAGCPDEMEGCLSDYFVVPEKCCYGLPDSMDFSIGALLEPFTIGVYAVELAGALTGKTVGILGAGPIGACVLAAARAAGAGDIYVSEPIEARRQLAARHGATWTGDPHREDIVAGIADTEPLLLDVVFECCGKQEALDQAADLLKPGGKLMLIGIPEPERISFVIDTLRRRELCIQNVRRQNECVEKAIAIAARPDVDLDWMITHHFGMEDTKTAFDLVDSYGDGVLKAMIHVGNEE